MLRQRHKLFADEWLSGEQTGKPFNGRAAYEFAGYTISDSNPSGNASKLLRHPEVKAYIDDRLQEHSMDATEIMLRFSNIARSNIGDILVMAPNGNVTVDEEALLENKHFIKSFGYDSNGNPKIEFHDPVAALRDLARVHSMFHDSVELGGPGGVPLSMDVNFVMPDGQKAAFGPTSEKEEDPEDFTALDAESGEVLQDGQVVALIGPAEDEGE